VTRLFKVFTLNQNGCCYGDKLRWAGRVAPHEAEEIPYNTHFSENLKDRSHLGNGRTLLKWILKEYSVRVWGGYIWLRIESRDKLL
jgi:hypothetical protein